MMYSAYYCPHPLREGGAILEAKAPSVWRDILQARFPEKDNTNDQNLLADTTCNKIYKTLWLMLILVLGKTVCSPNFVLRMRNRSQHEACE